MLQTGIFWFFLFKGQILLLPAPLLPVWPHLTLQIGNYVTITMGFQWDTSGQISELKGTEGGAGSQHMLGTAGYDVLSCLLKTKLELCKRLLSNQIFVGTCMCPVGQKTCFFVLKLDFPGKNNGKIKGDKCLVGQKEQNPLPRRSCSLVSAKLLAVSASQAGAKRWSLQLCQEQKSNCLGSSGTNSGQPLRLRLCLAVPYLGEAPAGRTRLPWMILAMRAIRLFS